MPLERVGHPEDPESEKNFQEIFDKAQSKVVTDMGTSAPSGQMNGEGMGIVNVSGTHRLYVKCPDGSWCYVTLT